MNILKSLKYFFSIDTKSSNRVIIYVLGIRIRFLKPGLKEKYVINADNAAQIPKAQGSLRKIQLANLKMMLIFDELCKKHNLQYWIDFGNLLGAVRHGGFIPWDDDVDLGMIRHDYEKFIELFKNKVPGHDDLYLEFDNNGKNKCFLKIKHRKLQNIALDIFPYDFYYKKVSIEEQKNLTNEMCKVRNSIKYKLLQPFFINNPYGMRKRFEDLRNNVILKGHKVNIAEKPSLFYGIDYPHTYDNYFFDYDKIFPIRTIKYEDYDFPCPNDVNSVLTQIFGNYMAIPKDCYPRHTNSENYNEKVLDDFIRGDE